MISITNSANETLTHIREIEGESNRMTAARAAVKIYGKKVAYVHKITVSCYQAYTAVKSNPGSYSTIGSVFYI